MSVPNHRALLLLAALALALPAAGQPAGGEGSGSHADLSREEIEGRIAGIAHQVDLDESERSRAVDFYRQAIDQIDAAAHWSFESKRIDAARGEIDERIRDLRTALAQVPASEKIEIPEGALLGELRQVLREEQASLASYRRKLAALTDEIEARPARTQALPGLLESARERRAELERRLASQGEHPDDATDPVRAAQSVLLETSVMAASQQIAAYQAEQRSYEPRGRIIAARHDLAARQVALAERRVAAWTQAVDRARRAEAERAAHEAYLALTKARPNLRDIAGRNRELALQRVGAEGLAAKIETAAAELERVEHQLTLVEADFSRVRARVVAIGYSKVIGYFLRTKRTELPDVARGHSQRRARQREVREVQFDRAELNDERERLVLDLPGEVTRALERLPEVPEADDVETRRAVEELLQNGLPLLDALIDDHDRYFRLLVDIDDREGRLQAVVRDYDAFIVKRILWTPGADSLGPDNLAPAGRAFAWLLDPNEWRDLLRVMGVEAKERRAALTGLVALLLAIGLPRRVWRRRLTKMATHVRQLHSYSIRPTLAALNLTVVLALFWPGLLYLPRWLLLGVENVTDFSHAAGRGLRVAALGLFVMNFWLQVCREDGLGDAHFGWSPSHLKAMKTTARRLSYVFLPAMSLSVFFYTSAEAAWAESAGRMLLILALLFVALLALLALRKNGGLLRDMLKTGSLRFLWIALFVLTPLALAAVAAVGYTHTSLIFVRVLFWSGFLLFVAVVLYNLIHRWLRIVRAGIAFKEAMRARALAAGEQETAADGQRSDVPAVEAEPELDLGTLNEQTLRIVRTVLGLAFLVGVYLLSADLLPALEYLGQFELWSVTTDAGVRQITLVSLLTSGLILFLAVLGFRNLSGFLEFVLLSRLSIDRGLRFAIITLSQYLIVIVAVITAFNVLGVGWSRVQWLIAALSVGLGFGLQEIFANFVSGIVLLLERPIRVGDIVTVDNISGRVTRIRMRATTVMDFDRRELVVPNKSFITGNLINWTLTDPVIRVRIVVGVAYGSDTAKVELLLLTEARKHPTVLGDPRPQVIFHDFGNSSLTFWLHVFIPHRDLLLDVLHDLHMAIDQAFREAGIVIAFPQRDLHIDGSSPLDVRVVGEREEG